MHEAEFSVSSITSVEIRSALCRLESTRQITPIFADRAIQQVDAELKQFHRVDVSMSCWPEPQGLFMKSGYVRWMRFSLPRLYMLPSPMEPLTFVAADRRLLEAAQASGLSILNPEQAGEP